MFWIRSYTGDLCNLALASDLVISNDAVNDPGNKNHGKHAIMACFPGGMLPNKTPIFYGTKQECEKTREEILKKLIARQNAVDIAKTLG